MILTKLIFPSSNTCYLTRFSFSEGKVFFSFGLLYSKQLAEGFFSFCRKVFSSKKKMAAMSVIFIDFYLFQNPKA